LSQAVRRARSLPDENEEYEDIRTTPYRLIEAINEELQPGEEELIVKIVLNLVKNNRVLALEVQLKKPADHKALYNYTMTQRADNYFHPFPNLLVSHDGPTIIN